MKNHPDSTYEELSSEYYDVFRHPTSANFREASAHLLRSWLNAFSYQGGVICEVGAGKSLLAELLDERGLPLDKLILTDSSASMLNYSSPWSRKVAAIKVAQADALDFLDASVELLVASLGDPFNESGFWREAARVLQPTGTILFTTPSNAWARSFRKLHLSERNDVAMFDLSDGRHVYVPSLIYSVTNQTAMIQSAALHVADVDHVTLSALRTERISKKLFGENGEEAQIATGYRVVK